MIMRYKWCQDGGVNQRYHDEEQGIPVHDDRKHFKSLMMEVMQCGLNWTMMLNKRGIFRRCSDNFGYEKVIRYDKKKTQGIMETPGVIRPPRKVQAVITNARAYLEIIQEYGSFDKFLRSYTDGRTLVYKSHQQCPITSSDVSDAVSRELEKRDFKYLGSITVYSHLQACDMINDHEESCSLYRRFCDGNSMECRD